MSEVPRVAVVIPTRNRPDCVCSVIDQLADQRLVPQHVVIVDASSVEKHVDLQVGIGDDRPFDIDLIHVSKGSAPRQRNIGLREVLRRGEVDAIQFLDDDVTFDSAYLSECANALFKDSRGGVCAATVGGTGPRDRVGGRLFEKFFLLGPNRPGSVSSTGRNAGVFWNPTRKDPVDSDWVLGCAMFRREAIEGLEFWDELDGYVLFDDVEFSARVRKRWGLSFLPWVALGHFELSTQTRDPGRDGFQMVYNRFRVVRTVNGSVGLFWWSVFGLLLRAVMGSALGRHASIARLRGILRGVGAICGDTRAL